AVELKDDIRPENRDRFMQWLGSQESLIPGSLQKVGEDELKAILEDDLAGDSIQQQIADLVPDILVFKLKKEYLVKDKLAEFEKKLYQQEVVRHFSYQNELTMDISAAVRRIQLGFLGVTLLFMVIGVLISDYLAQVFVDSRSSVIRTWNDLGAAAQKILAPYLRRVVFLGLASACLSVCLMGVMVLLVAYLLPWAGSWIETKKFMGAMAFLLILGPILQYVLVKRKIQMLIK
ncbi:MAG TPA: hypothetical protein VFX48_06055, partial [Saprospiraceae bacterium]|nr:hypothetical protein [Saprospiraceae bacterium]